LPGETYHSVPKGLVIERALGAGVYLLWLRWRTLKRGEAQATLTRQKEQLDALLDRTLRIEKKQMQTTDVKQLHTLLNDVTRIKLTALQEFTEEQLRADQDFTIFLMQCANLINKIQLKIITHGAQTSDHSPGIGTG
jgi:hypothetical protein